MKYKDLKGIGVDRLYGCCGQIVPGLWTKCSCLPWTKCSFTVDKLFLPVVDKMFRNCGHIVPVFGGKLRLFRGVDKMFPIGKPPFFSELAIL